MNDGVTLNGRALARNGAVTLINDTITAPHCATAASPAGSGSSTSRARCRPTRAPAPTRACSRTTSSSRCSSTPASTRRAPPGPGPSGRGPSGPGLSGRGLSGRGRSGPGLSGPRRASSRRGRTPPGPARRAQLVVEPSAPVTHERAGWGGRRRTGQMTVRASFRRLTSIEPVWWLSAVIGASAIALYLLWIRHEEPIQGPEIAWWALGLMVVVTERWPIELQFRRSTHCVHADRRPADARARLRDRHARLLRRAGRLAGRAGAPPDAAGQARLQPRAVRARDGRADRRRAPGRLRRPGLRVDHVGRRARGDPDRRRAGDRADPRGDGADRGPRLARSGAPDVRHGPGGHDDRHGRWRSSSASSGSSGRRRRRCC